MPTSDNYENVLCALCVWREARNASQDAKRAVVWVLKNRAAHPEGPYRNARTMLENVLAPRQFSSFNANDPNAALMPNPRYIPDFAAWMHSCAAVDDPGEDPTNGANYYESVGANQKRPDWATPENMTVTIGAIRFYRL